MLAPSVSWLHIVTWQQLCKSVISIKSPTVKVLDKVVNGIEHIILADTKLVDFSYFSGEKYFSDEI